MNSMELLSDALAYMEEHLDSEIKTEDVARACYCSKSTLEKLFRCVNNVTVREYLVRRRMMKAARLLMERPKVSILETALRYGYSTNESFSRAFKQVWNCKPSEFRSRVRFSEVFPRLERPLECGDDYMRKRKHVDISELYDLFATRKDCYFVCCDIKNMVSINEISRKAGDMAILETMQRMDDAAGEGDIVFRIGGDEFALLTDSTDEQYVQQIVETVKSKNEQVFCCDGKEIPLSLHTGTARFGKKTIKYNELFTGLHTAIRDSK